jgi:putative FmdB family regulatory protein
VPLYEYQCQKCAHRFEKIERTSASITKKCPKCGARAERLFAAPAFQFKGTGWYVTDYAGKNAGSAGGDKSEEKAGAKSEDKGKSDEKPSATKEPVKKTKND